MSTRSDPARVRRERPDDVPAVRRVNEAAFGRAVEAISLTRSATAAQRRCPWWRCSRIASSAISSSARSRSSRWRGDGLPGPGTHGRAAGASAARHRVPARPGGDRGVPPSGSRRRRRATLSTTRDSASSWQAALGSPGSIPRQTRHSWRSSSAMERCRGRAGSCGISPSSVGLKALALRCAVNRPADGGGASRCDPGTRAPRRGWRSPHARPTNWRLVGSPRSPAVRERPRPGVLPRFRSRLPGPGPCRRTRCERSHPAGWPR